MAAKDSFSRLAGGPNLPIGARPPREQGVGRISEELNGRVVECAQHATRRPEGRRAFRRARALLILCTSEPDLNHCRGFIAANGTHGLAKGMSRASVKASGISVLAAASISVVAWVSVTPGRPWPGRTGRGVRGNHAAFAVTLRDVRPTAHVPRYLAFLASFAFTRPTTVGMTETSTMPTISSSKCS